jgi:hypothetical protein
MFRTPRSSDFGQGGPGPQCTLAGYTHTGRTSTGNACPDRGFRGTPTECRPLGNKPRTTRLEGATQRSCPRTSTASGPTETCQRKSPSRSIFVGGTVAGAAARMTTPWPRRTLGRRALGRRAETASGARPGPEVSIRLPRRRGLATSTACFGPGAPPTSGRSETYVWAGLLL